MRLGAIAASLTVAMAFCVPRPASADELKLKDGTKIVGTIVGYEENSFKVKTNYGFAVVQKDQVVSISISDSAKEAEAGKKPEPAAVKPAPASPPVNSYKNYKNSPPAQPAPSASSDAAPAVTAVADPSPSHPAARAPAAIASPSAGTVRGSSTPVPAPATAPAKGAPPAAAPPPPPPPPESMREVVTGNLYRNDTYGFHMYKPPTWQLVEGARTVLPGAITALGTSDQTTYLLIGRQSIEKSFTADIDATERHLRTTLDNYRQLSDKKIVISGAPAVERRFRVSVDQHDWSGVAVFFQHDAHLYTIFGMTAAESDLVQIQENVISRAIASIEFTKQ
jgi:hypothetical protein